MRVWVALLTIAIWAAPACSSTEKPVEAPGATVVTQEQVGPRLLDLTVRSTALNRTAKVRLLTPDGWTQRTPTDRWPVLYLLHGCCDSYISWTRSSDIEDIAQLRDVLVVMPDGGSVGWYSDWWNHGRGGPPAWATYHLDELRTLLERDYGAGQRRVIAGVSMGGLGALLYAARSPGIFAATASYSGVVHPLYDGFPRGLMRVSETFGADPLALWGDPSTQRSIWAAHDPYYLASRLRSVPVFLSCGDGSGTDSLEAALNEMNRTLAPRLTQAGVHLTTDFYRPGTHSWPYFERELHRSLPFLLSALHS